jgi:pyruvate/2-oxoglutarate dehydrogenase complex dihydrolipoamide acyltransferase (E2) component
VGILPVAGARDVERVRLSAERRLVIGSVRAGRRAAPMHGVLAVDVTEIRERLSRADPPGSFTAAVVAAVARTAAAHPEVHAYRDLRGRLVRPHAVDVTVMVEVTTPRGPVAVAHLLRDADRLTVADLGQRLTAVRVPAAVPRRSDRSRAQRWLLAVPGVIPLLYTVLGRTDRGRRSSGTVLVTAVGMFGGGGGFAIAPSGLHSLTVVVGGMSTRPWMHDGAIAARTVVDLTISVDHRVVDGAPAARFAADLRRCLEDATVVDDWA